MLEYWPAFVLGILGSTHCVGMCGAIAISLPKRDVSSISHFLDSLWYNLGRITTYGIMGLLFGLIGNTLVFAGWQRWGAIILGVFLLFAALSYLQSNKVQSLQLLPTFFVSFLQKKIGQLWRNPNQYSTFLIGSLNGGLPCGLVYVALAGALGTGNVWQGSLFMFAFGLGTLPLMFGLTLFGQFLGMKFRSRIRQISPYFLMLIALLLIFRGLNIQIPSELYFWEIGQNVPMCH